MKADVKWTRGGAGQIMAIFWNSVIFFVFVSVSTYFLLLDRQLPETNLQKAEAGLYERYLQLKVRGFGKADVILLGDSRITQGVSPKELTAQLAGQADKGLNLGFYAAGFAPIYYDLAERRLQKNSPCRIILLGITPLTLTKKNARNEQLRAAYFRPWIMAQAYILFPRLMGWLSRESVPFEVAVFPGVRDYYDDGWMSYRMPPNSLSEANVDWVQDHYHISPVHEDVVNSLMQKTSEWTKAGIEVFAFRPPVSAEMFKIEEDLSGFNEEALVQEFRSHGGHWIDIDPFDYRTFDNSHLPRHEALRLSARLGQEINRVLSSPPASTSTLRVDSPAPVSDR